MYPILFSGYGFVDFEGADAAQRAVTALLGQGIQAQMAKVSSVSYFFLCLESRYNVPSQ